MYTNYQLPAGSYPQQQQQQMTGTYPTAAYSADPFAPSAPAPGSAPPAAPGDYYSAPVNDYYSAPTNDYYAAPASQTAYGFSSSMPPSTTVSNELVPSYGAPPSSSMPPRSITPPPTVSPSASQDEEVDPAMAAIIKSQERALAQAKKRSSPGSSGGNSRAVTRTKTPKPLNTSNLDATGMRKSHKLSDAVIPSKHHMKAERKTKTAAGATSGAIIGGIMFGPAFPVGMVLGGAVGGYATNKISKSGERRAQRKFEQQNFQKIAQKSAVKNAAYV